MFYNKSLSIETCWSIFCWLKQIFLTSAGCDCRRQYLNKMERWDWLSDLVVIESCDHLFKHQKMGCWHGAWYTVVSNYFNYHLWLPGVKSILKTMP